MKKFENLGKQLSKDEQRKIKGAAGTEFVDSGCGTCSTGDRLRSQLPCYKMGTLCFPASLCNTPCTTHNQG